MRFDSIGLFWEDQPKQKSKKAGRDSVPRVLPPIPDTGWSCPATFPRLESAECISIDLETYDPELKSKGPGPRRDGYIVGIAVGVPTGERWYFPMRHSVGSNLNPDAVLAWAKDELCRPSQPKVGANLLYDLDYLWSEGVPVCGEIIDVLVAEPLLDENQYRYNLDRLAEQYLGEHKVDEELYRWSSAAYGGAPTRKDQAANIWRCPPELVGPYAEGDVDLPLRIWQKQKNELERQGLMDLYDLESDITYPLLHMRQNGVRVDSERALEVDAIMQQREVEAQLALDNLAGFEVNVWANASIEEAFKRLQVPYGKTKTGKASFTKPFLEHCDHPVAQMILEVRRWSKNRGTFVEGYINDYAIDGRIHALFHQLKSDDGGTVSGRFSSSNPNLQNIPSRDDELKKLIRSLFIPEDGCRWRRYDWSQIEYRFLVHYARGKGANDAVRQYRDNPMTDYHEMTRTMVKQIMNYILERGPTKNINFGLVYGMGVPKLSGVMGVDEETAAEMVSAYHDAVPFVKSTFEYAENRAKSAGEVRTVLGRRARFPLWSPTSYKNRDKLISADRDEVVQKFGSAERAYAYRALNRVLQGSSADLMKKTLRDAYKAGIFDVVGYPLNIVHDEFNFNDDMTAEANEAFDELRYIMENCIKLRVPVVAEPDVGPNWGKLNKLIEGEKND